jgi:HEAT repeat protein
MQRISPNKSKHRSNTKLVRNALRQWETDTAWQAICELQMRGSLFTLDLIHRLVRSKNWRKRCLGCLVAAQLRKRETGSKWQGSEYGMQETQALLLDCLGDVHLEVVKAAISGLGHRPHPNALPKLVSLSLSRDTQTRWNVAVALGRYSEQVAIDALLCLARDVNSGVRDWATFGLGSLQKTDTPEIRDLLWANLHDQDSDVRGEALVGLAGRHDPRAVAYLLTHLDASCQVYEFEAAEVLGDASLLERLQTLAAAHPATETDSYWRGRLESAISACSHS